MKTIQIVLDETLLRAADLAAKEEKVNRSALLRIALAEFLRRREICKLERQDREGYARIPDSVDDLGVWDGVAAWPDS